MSTRDEILHRFFRDHPEAVGDAFRAAGLKKFPDTARVRELPDDVTTIEPPACRVESAMYIEAEDGRSFILVIETQSKPDNAKRRRWPYDIAYLHERYKCPVLLVVICQDAATARWARTPVLVTTGFWTTLSLFPCVLGPENVPLPEEIGEADLFLGALCVITRAREIGEGEMRKLACALKQADAGTRADLGTYVHLGLGSLPAADIWRRMVPSGSGSRCA